MEGLAWLRALPMQQCTLITISHQVWLGISVGAWHFCGMLAYRPTRCKITIGRGFRFLCVASAIAIGSATCLLTLFGNMCNFLFRYFPDQLVLRFKAQPRPSQLFSSFQWDVPVPYCGHWRCAGSAAHRAAGRGSAHTSPHRF